MSSKVKVAVRVRPLNKRGEISYIFIFKQFLDKDKIFFIIIFIFFFGRECENVVSTIFSISVQATDVSN